MRTFNARYRGFCGACGGDIDPGDQVGYSEDDSLIHADCDELVQSEPTRSSVCPVCFTEIPATGVCGVCPP